ncbi:partial putative signaling protein, partial [Patescibacteria group bacterium]
EVTGYSAKEVLGKNPKILKSGFTTKETYDQLWNTLNQGNSWRGELVNRRKNGEIYWEEAHIAPVKDNAGKTTHYVSIKIDITQRKFLQEKLRFLFEASPLGFALNELETGSFIEINDAMIKGTGYSKSEFLALSYWDLTPREYELQEQQQLESLLNTGHYGPYEKEYIRKDGTRYPVVLNGMLMHDINGNQFIWSIVENITERKQAEETIKQLAFYDPLTQLPNRRLLQERLEQAIRVSRRTGHLVAVLMMDLDKFKNVNDNLGHAAGDELLKQVSRRVTERLREMDIVARLGGDEFVIVLEKITNIQHIAPIVEAIIYNLSQPFTLYDTHQVTISASLGIALYPEHGETVEILLDNADIALYQAKDAGRNCFAYFSKS